MRLSESESDAIKEVFRLIFHTGKIYLFGSRTDDDAKGGDIDLYLDVPHPDLEKKIDFLAEVKSRIGDQKIDVVLSHDKSRYIEREAVSKGILL